MQSSNSLQARKVARWHQTCAASAMSRSIGVSDLCPPHRNTQSRWEIQTGTHGLLQSRQCRRGRVFAPPPLRPSAPPGQILSRPRGSLSTPPLVSIFKPPFAMILLWSARRAGWVLLTESPRCELSSGPGAFIFSWFVPLTGQGSSKAPFFFFFFCFCSFYWVCASNADYQGFRWITFLQIKSAELPVKLEMETRFR